jgi:hypothetical protein
MQPTLNEILPRMPKKTKEKYIMKSIESCNSCIVSFDLWMFRTRIDTFVLNVHFLNDKWEPCRVTNNLFETTKTFRSVMVLQVIEILAKHGFNVGVIVNVKDRLSTMNNTLVFVVSCEVLGLIIPFSKTCWGHVYV